MSIKSDLVAALDQIISPELEALTSAALAYAASRGTVTPPVTPPTDTLKYYATHNIQAYDFGMGMLDGKNSKTQFAVNEDVWFHFHVANIGNQPEGFEILSAKAEEGPCGQSWTSYTLQTGNDGVLKWEDHLHFQVPGVYHLYLGIGFGNKDDLVAGREQWIRLSDSITITVTA